MYHLRLIKGKSYWGIVRASESAPDVYVPEKEQAERLVRSGYFTLVGGTQDVSETEAGEDSEEPNNIVEDMFEAEESENGSQENPVLVELQSKNKAELIEYAKQKGINITGCKTKDDIMQNIVEAIARAEAARAVFRGE